jgi:hypothetical protein
MEPISEKQLTEWKALADGSDHFDVMLRGLRRDAIFLGGLGDPKWNADGSEGVTGAPRRRDNNLNPTTVELLLAVRPAIHALVAEVRRLRGTDAWTGLDVDGKALAEARRAERERCAQLADQTATEHAEGIGHVVAERIRALPDEP